MLCKPLYITPANYLIYSVRSGAPHWISYGLAGGDRVLREV